MGIKYEITKIKKDYPVVPFLARYNSGRETGIVLVHDTRTIILAGNIGCGSGDTLTMNFNSDNWQRSVGNYITPLEVGESVTLFQV